ncbi:hypothetical protein DER46DRAFT_679346 [Fusarium sp. MPI-SDFR-AT-0072]|nr:hypothetical protein DER46DRAFT_679346 [Fusarium sp. MPI-SDFR-AT-0072]
MKSFGFFFGSVILWTLQTQLALQIIANRLGLIMINKKRAKYLKLSLLVAVGLINIAVACIWIPARLTQSERLLHVNGIWDRTEKVIYLLIDLALNSTFLYQVRRELIANGLAKYKLLFNFNASVVFISLSMDILIIVMMSLPNPFLYAIFHPVAYSVKLIIEIIMADLIAKIVRRQNELNSYHDTTDTNSTRAAALSPCEHQTARDLAPNQEVMLRPYHETVRDGPPTPSLAVVGHHGQTIQRPSRPSPYKFCSGRHRSLFPEPDGHPSCKLKGMAPT